MDELKKLQKEMEVLQKKHDELVSEKDELQKKHEELTAKHDETVVELEKLTKKPDPKDDMPADVKKRFEDLEKNAKDKSDLIKKLLDEKGEAIYLAKAKGFKSLPVKPEEFGPIMKRISEGILEEDMKELEKILVAADEAITTGRLFKEQGQDGDGFAGDAMKKMEAKAEEIMKSDSSVKTKEQAFTKVMESDPALYDEYLSEKSLH